MPRVFSNALKREFAQLESDHCITCLLELTIPGGPVPFRLANYPEEIVFHGLYFAPFGCQIDDMEDASSQALVHLRVAFENVTQQLSSLLEYYWVWTSKWACTIWTIDVQQPDQTLWTDGQVYLVAQVVTEHRSAVADLVAEGLSLGSTVPKRRYTALSGFSSIPKRIGF